MNGILTQDNGLFPQWIWKVLESRYYVLNKRHSVCSQESPSTKKTQRPALGEEAGFDGTILMMGGTKDIEATR